TNGTYVNDEMVLWRKGLYDDDKIAVGKYTLVFKDTVQGKKAEPEKLMPDFLDSTIKVPKKRWD
ncbi:MAG: FHA domain-containing protein, partial [Thermodesulfovibrionales bacterium]